MKTIKTITNLVPRSLTLGLGLAFGLTGCDQLTFVSGPAPGAAPPAQSAPAAPLQTSQRITSSPATSGKVFQAGCVQPPGSTGLPESLPLGESGNYPFCHHVDQTLLPGVSFTELFDAGDELFDTAFNAEDGVGANLADDDPISLRFSRIPRADLPGFDNRATGPNSSSCASCHNVPVDDGAGDANSNAIRDPQHTADPNSWITRNTPHVMGMGAVQLLAEEMTSELWDARDRARTQAAATGYPVKVKLTAKGINFGSITVHSSGKISTGGLRGIDKDLVVKPFQWKGAVPTIRDFAVDASHNELGMDPVELVGEGVDADHDGVANEFSVGDMSVMTVYLAGTNRPTTLTELEGTFGAPMTDERREAIYAGEQLFKQIGCANCHTPSLQLSNHIFTEPSQHPAYRHETFGNGKRPIDMGVDPAKPLKVDLTRDPRLPFRADGGSGEIKVELFSDLKRHDMGYELAENIDEVGTGESVFITKPLWGVGSTPPYLHDGRAGTLTEAIKFHGGEGAQSRKAFKNLAPADKARVIEFMKNLILFK
jgi:cytochrome c peroxidase